MQSGKWMGPGLDPTSKSWSIGLPRGPKRGGGPTPLDPHPGPLVWMGSSFEKLFYRPTSWAKAEGLSGGSRIFLRGGGGWKNISANF